MFGSKTLKAALTGTTALIGVAMLMAPTPARAGNPINGNQGATEFMTPGEALTVGNAGNVATVAAVGVEVNGVTATSVENNGTIGGAGVTAYGIIVEVAGNISNGVDNFGTIFGSGTGNAILIETASNIGGGITNEFGALINGSGNGIQVYNSTMTGLISNAGIINVARTGILVSHIGNISAVISNTGSINGGFNGIRVQSGSNISTVITNEAGATISGIAGTNVAGISVNGAGSDIHGGITNLATATISGTASGTTAAAVVAGGISVTSTAHLSGAINNSGTISASATNNGAGAAKAAGIVVLGGGNIEGLITNTGTGVISGTAGGTGAGAHSGAGIYVKSGSSISGGIDNTGHITGSTLGIGVVGGGNISAAINNNVTVVAHAVTATGHITGNNTGILVTGSGSQISGGIDNHGVIQDAASYGINVAAGGVISTIDNAVTVDNNPDALHQVILATGQITGQAAGINVTGADSNINGAGVLNAGTITGTAGAGISVASGGDISGGITNNVTLGTVGGVPGTLLATGLINGTTYGVHVASGRTGTSTTGFVAHISHISGTINNSGTIHGGNTGIGVTTGGDISGNIINSGHITGNNSGILVTGKLTTGPTSALVSTFSQITGTIDNSGTISGNNGIYVSGGGLITGLITNEVAGHITGASSSGVRVSGAGSAISGGIDNKGTISGADGIMVSSGGHISGLLTNEANAHITGASTGIVVTGAGSQISGGIDNFGTIQDAAQYGINVAAGGTITNSGGGNAITNNATGIIIGDLAGIHVTGAGSITSGTSGFGISNAGAISGTTYGVHVENSGSINGASGGILNNTTGFIVGGNTGIRVESIGSISSIDNYGHVTGNTDSGMRVTGTGSAISGDITNEAGGVISGGSQGIDITEHGSVGGAIVNYGTISGATHGINLYNNSTVGSVDNYGHITGDRAINVSATSDITGGVTNEVGGLISGVTTGINVHGGSNITGGVDNYGTIHGGTNGIYVSNASISGGITNETGGVIDPVAGVAISLNGLTGVTPITIGGVGGTTDGSDNAAGLDTNDPRIIGDVTDDFGLAFNRSPVTVNSDFITEGNFTVSSLAINDGAFTISGPDTISLQTFTSVGGTIKFGINSNTQFGHILVATGAADLTGTTLAVKVGSNSTLTNGTQLKILQGDGVDAAVAAPANGTLLTDNSFLWNFSIFDGLLASTPTNVSDLFLQAILAHPIIATPGNQNVFDVLESLTGTSDPQLLEILGNLNNAGTNGAVSNILDSTLPTVNGSDYGAFQDVSDNALDLEDQQLASARTGGDGTTGMAAGNMAKGVGAWGQVFGQHSNQGTRENIGGYSANTWGGALGVDSRNVSDKALMGLGFAYGRTNASSDNANTTDTNVDSYQVSLYGNYDIARNSYLSGIAGYTWGNVDETRHNIGVCCGVGGLTAHGSYNTRAFSAQAEAGHDYAMQGGMKLTPNVLAHWSNWNPDSYTETGAGGADLHVNGNTLNVFELGGGVKAGWSFKNRDGSYIKPMLHAGYRYNFADNREVDTANFTGGGTAFSVPGPRPGRSTVDLGASVKFVTTRNWDLSASYNFDWKDNYTSNSGFLRAAYKF